VWQNAELVSCNHEAAGSTTPTVTVYQRQLSVTSIQGQLMSTSKAGSKRAYHAMH